MADSPASDRADSPVRDSLAADNPDIAASEQRTFSLCNRSLGGAVSSGHGCDCGFDCARGRGRDCARQSEIAIVIGFDCDFACDCGSDRGNSH